MFDDFFLGFAGHAHTRNDLEADPNKSEQLRRENSVEEALRLTEAVLSKLEKDISDAGYHLKDVKLLILYLSYRGETEEKDRLISENILKAIDKRFEGKTASEQLRLIGHTTAGEIENEDIELKEISGIGYNGLSLMALVTNLPIGVGRTWGIRTEKEAVEHGKEMAHDAWVDLGQSTESKEHLQKSKTLLVLAKGPSIGKAGYEYFLATGIADFVRSAREARIANVFGGMSGDGILGKNMHQFYCKIGRHSELKILDTDAVCALIPNMVEPSFGLDISPMRRIGESYTFHFDSDAEPKFKHLKRIGDQDPRKVHARIICENEAQISRFTGLPAPTETDLFQQISEIDGIPLNLNLAKYAYAFPFGNYVPASLLRVHGQTIELLQPIRSHDPSIPGYVVVLDHEKVQKGARNVYDMLRENRGFREKDATLIVTCISRRLVEMGAGCRSNTEPEILKEALSSTQVIGFLAYGELSFTHLLQEPYVYNFSCWGTTLRSVIDGKEEANPEEAIGTRLRETSHQRMGAGERIENVTSEMKREDSATRALPKSKTAAEAPQGVPGHVATGYADLDRLLRGGIPENYTVALTAPSCDERELLVKSFLETGVRKGEVTFYLTVDPGDAESLTKEAHSNFHLFICNPQADSITKSLTNVTKLKGVENLTEISIALTSAIRKLDKPLRNQRRFCIGITSDVLLQHRAVQTRRWLTGLIPELRSAGFTSLAVIDPQMHPFDELHAILGVFEGEINVYEKESDKGLGKYVKIKKMINQRYVKDELCLAKEDLQNEIKRAKRGYPL